MAGAAHTSGYGADQVGLICGYRFNADGGTSDIDSASAAAWLGNASADGDFVWLHFNLSHAVCEKWLQSKLGLPPAFFEALHEGSRSTRIEYADDALIAVVNDVLYDFQFDPSDTSTLWVCTTRRALITARAKPLRSVDKLRAAVRRGEPFRTPAELLVHLLRDQADVLVQIVRETTRQVDRTEDQLLLHRLEANRTNLGALRRVLVRLQRLLAPEPGSLFRLLNRPPPWLAEHDVQDLRESTEEFAVVLNDLNALVERIKLLQEEIAAMLNEQTNRSVFILTMVTVLALPINIVAGLLGMNVGGVPLAQHPNGFWWVVGLVLTVTGAAGFWAFRKRGS